MCQLHDPFTQRGVAIRRRLAAQRARARADEAQRLALGEPVRFHPAHQKLVSARFRLLHSVTLRYVTEPPVKRSKGGLGELEREVMRIMWSHPALTAEDVRAKLRRPLKEATVRTVLRRLCAMEVGLLALVALWPPAAIFGFNKCIHSSHDHQVGRKVGLCIKRH